MTTKKQNEKMLKVIEDNGYTYHLSIKTTRETDEAYDLFEGIQNDFSLYDNCVLESDISGLPERIIIESKDRKKLMFLATSIKFKYPSIKKFTIKKVDKSETIIDKGRDYETGGLPI